MQLICEFIKQQREAKNISLEKLSSGICHLTYLSHDIERSGNITDKFLIDALLQRLGVSDDYFEHLVTNDDITIQNIRLNIFENIKSNNYKKIEELLKQYPKCKIDKIHTQFKEYIKAILLKKQSAPIDKVIDQHLNAIKTTLLKFDGKNIGEMLLSSVEACIIFEYAVLVEQKDSVKGSALYNQLFRYFNKPDIETGIKCRILPKLIYNMCKIWLEDKKYKPVLNLCNIGIECLRENQKFYYFTKLLELKIEVIEKSQLGNEDYEQAKEWYEILIELYEEYQVNPNDDNIIFMQNFLWQNYDAIGDVIRKRRKMLGMTQTQLCEGICDHKTISRIERLQGKHQIEIVEKLLQRLNLSGQLYSDAVVTDDYETFILVREANLAMSKNNFDVARNLLEKLKDKLDLNNKTNLQYVRHKEIIISKQLNEISIENTLLMYKKTLTITIDTEKLFTVDEKYLTKKEIILINNIISFNNLLKINIENEKWIDLLRKYYINKSSNHNASYFFTLKNIASILGNQNLFLESNKLTMMLIEDTFINNKCDNLCRLLYMLAWNYKNNEKENLINDEKQIIYMRFIKTSYVLSVIQTNDYYKNLIETIIKAHH